MTQTITFGNFKGGVGKTSNSTLVALDLSDRGYKTLLVDLDPQGNATNLLLNTKVNIDGKVGHFKKSLMASIEDGDLTQSLIHIKEDFDILASAPDFALFPRYMEKIKDYNERVKEFSNLIKPIKEKYDYVIIDTPPTISLITDSALYASDYCVIVMQTHEHSFEGAQAFIEYIQEQVIDTYKAPRLEIVGILAVLLQAGAPVDEATIQNAINQFGTENIFKHKIHSMQRIKRYGITGITFNTQFDKRVFKVYKDVTDEMLKRMEAIEHG